MTYKYHDVLKECRQLAKSQNIVFRRSKTVNQYNNKACYEIESGIQYKILCQGNLMLVWDNLLSGNFKDQ